MQIGKIATKVHYKKNVWDCIMLKEGIFARVLKGGIIKVEML